MEEFLKEFAAAAYEDSLLGSCRRSSLFATPAVFAGDEARFYHFCNHIAQKFDVSFRELFITGSTKLVVTHT